MMVSWILQFLFLYTEKLHLILEWLRKTATICVCAFFVVGWFASFSLCVLCTGTAARQQLDCLMFSGGTVRGRKTEEDQER